MFTVNKRATIERAQQIPGLGGRQALNPEQ